MYTGPAARETLMIQGSSVVAVEAMTCAMQRFPTDERLAVRGCRLLSLLPYPNATLQSHVGAGLHACAVLVSCLSTFVTDRVTTASALCAMASLSQGHVGNQERLSDACPHVLRALNAFPQDKDVQWYG
jgi:hypothetical protein